jgi:hypothetical protein
VFGLDDASFSTIDIGRERDGGDLLQIAGYQNSNRLASAARWAHLLLTNNVMRYNSKIPGKEVLRIVQEDYPDLPNYLRFGSAQMSRNTTVRQGVVAGIAYVLSRKNPEKAEDFFMKWKEPAYWPNTVFHHLQNNIVEINRFALANKTGTPVPKVASVILAWNLWLKDRKGRSQADVVWKPTDPFPTIEDGKGSAQMAA